MIKSPIIVIESNDIGVYKSPEHAVSHLELTDIKEGIFTAYDSEGFLLDFQIYMAERDRIFLWFRWKEHFEKAILKEHEPASNCLGMLQEKLLIYLVESKGCVGKSFQGISLKALIELVAKDMPWKL